MVLRPFAFCFLRSDLTVSYASPSYSMADNDAGIVAAFRALPPEAVRAVTRYRNLERKLIAMVALTNRMLRSGYSLIGGPMMWYKSVITDNQPGDNTLARNIELWLESNLELPQKLVMWSTRPRCIADVLRGIAYEIIEYETIEDGSYVIGVRDTNETFDLIVLNSAGYPAHMRDFDVNDFYVNNELVFRFARDVPNHDAEITRMHARIHERRAAFVVDLPDGQRPAYRRERQRLVNAARNMLDRGWTIVGWDDHFPKYRRNGNNGRVEEDNGGNIGGAIVAIEPRNPRCLGCGEVCDRYDDENREVIVYDIGGPVHEECFWGLLLEAAVAGRFLAVGDQRRILPRINR